MKYTKATTILFWIILAISLFLIVSLFVNLGPDASDRVMSKWVGANLYWSYVLLLIAIIAAVVLEFMNRLSDKKASWKSLTGIGLFAGLILLSYFLSDTEMPKFYGAEKHIDNGTATPAMLLWIGTGLIASYILFAIAVIAIIWSAISKVFK